jgi:NAD(P)-dependent dehydrogenase (short-subunit alcohol dehydrogenase family)
MLFMANRLEGKVAVVTGAASRGTGVGNGKAAAFLLAREGAKVVLVNRSAERALALRDEILAEGGDATVVVGDVTDEATAQEIVHVAETTYGALHILINNVGIGGGGSAEGVSEKDWDEVLSVNLKSMMQCTKTAIPAMKRAGSGSVINISSTAGARGLTGGPGAAAYATSKAGMHGFTYSVAADFARDNIRANCVIVGTVDTPMVAALGDDARQRRVDMVPMGSRGTGWDVAWAVVFLASDEARWITGAFLPVDGGLMNLRQWPR